MSESHLPDLRHARNWLDEIRTDLLAARETLRTGHPGAARVVANTLEKHAETLGDIIARGEVVSQTWSECARELARYSRESEARDYSEQDTEGRRDHIYHAVAEILGIPLAPERQSEDPTFYVVGLALNPNTGESHRLAVCATFEAASEYIETLPDHEDGRYYIDACTAPVVLEAL